MSPSAPVGKKQDKLYTYSDYQKWGEDEQWELIDGVAYNMTAPTRKHQLVFRELFKQIVIYLDDKPCTAYSAPFDVRLPETDEEADNDIKTVVQPDIAVICDTQKLDDRGCRGAPDWIVEILSPFTASQDHIRKRALYEKHGVKEYWLVHLTDKVIHVYILNGKQYGAPMIYEGKGIIHVAIIPGMAIDLDAVFGKEF